MKSSKRQMPVKANMTFFQVYPLGKSEQIGFVMGWTKHRQLMGDTGTPPNTKNLFNEEQTVEWWSLGRPTTHDLRGKKVNSWGVI